MTSVLQSQHEHYAEVRRRLFNGAPRLVPSSEAVGGKREAPVELSCSVGLSQPSKAIIKEVCERHRLSPSAVLSRSRMNEIVIARHEIWHRVRSELGWSYPRIGKVIGGFDHTTVLSGVRAHEARKSQVGVARVWKGKPVAGYVSQTAAVLSLRSQGVALRAIERMTGISRYKITEIYKNQDARNAELSNG